MRKLFQYKYIIIFLFSYNSTKLNGAGNMVKIFSNTIISYLEEAINSWISKNNIKVINYNYSVVLQEGEILHSVLLVYESDDAKL